MTLALIFTFSLSLTLVFLLLRQVRLTRRARQDVDKWKLLYEQVRSDRAALLKALRALEEKGKTTLPRSDTKKKNLLHPTPLSKTNRFTAVELIKPGEQTSKAIEPLTLILPIQLLSKNSRDKLHYQARGRLRKQYREIIELKHPRRAPTPRVRQRATVTRVKGPRERDFDEQNIGAGSAIELMDALTAAGYWLDDSPKWLDGVRSERWREGQGSICSCRDRSLVLMQPTQPLSSTVYRRIPLLVLTGRWHRACPVAICQTKVSNIGGARCLTKPSARLYLPS